MVDLTKWLAAFSALTPVGGLALAMCFGGLRRSDYLIAKFVGLMVFAAPLWIAGYLRVPVLVSATLGCLLIAAGVGSLWSLRRLGVPIDWRAWARAEAAFAALVVIYVVVRGFNPTVLDGEKPMDMMLLSSTMRARTLPPEDAWMAGRSVDYYYFGFFAFGAVAKALRLSSFVAFTLGLASVWGASLLLTFHLGKSLVGTWRKALAFPLLYGLVGNLGALYQVLRDPGAIGWNFDWWAPSRAVPGAITEFPAFSYLFGEFHSHMMGTLWLGTTVVVLQRATTGSPSEAEEDRAPWTPLRPWALGTLLGVVGGELYATNSWSVVPLGTLAVVTLAIWSPKRSALIAALVGALAVVLPYVARVHPPAVSVELTTQRSPLGGWCLHWLVLASAVGWGLVVRPLNRFVVVLAIVGAVLVALPEIVFFRAVYEDRSNTVFKLWWDAWLMLSVAGAYGLVRLSEAGGTAKAFTLAHFAAGGLYLPFALPVRSGYFGRWYGIDPEPFVFMRHPYLEAPYRELVRAEPRSFYEPAANSYTERCLLSAFTGVPTFLGWKWHEIAWRDRDPEVLRRVQIADRIHGARVPPQLERSFRFEYAYDDGRLVRLSPVPESR